MGEKLMLYYKFVTDKGGLTAKTKLAAITKLPSTRAALEPDSEQTVDQFRKAIEQIFGEPAPRY